MGLRTDRLDAQDQSTPELDGVIDSASSARAGDIVMNEARINYLRMMTMTLLNELSSMTDETAHRRIDLKTEVNRFESELIRSALHTTKGQQRRAARLLGTNATTLNTKLKRLKIWIDDPGVDGFALPESSEMGLDEDGRPLTFGEAMLRYEVNLIRNALLHTGGNQSRAARLLGLPTTTLNTKIKKLGIDVSKCPLDSPMFGSSAQVMPENHSALR